VAWQQPGELREVPVSEPGPGEVLVKVGGAGACHSDLHILDMPQPGGDVAVRLPFTIGHENAGWIEQLGPGTTGFAPGDPVIVCGPSGCGLCMNCRMAMENYCQQPGGPNPAGPDTRSAAVPFPGGNGHPDRRSAGRTGRSD